jgi:L-amino acid N-acyltransferase YncA
MTIRSVERNDVEAITAIYNYYIENTIITFEEEMISVSEMASRIEAISIKYPFLVYEENGTIAGYAYATPWKVRSAYRYSAENTIYLHPDAKGKGIGSALFQKFLDEINKTGLHALIGGIALPNNASVALHEKFGFKKVAQFEETGFKFGKWIDVGYWELKLK